MNTLYSERDYTYGTAMLALRTAIGLTQEGLAKHLGISRQAVGKWEAGSIYPKAEHLKAVIVLAIEHQAFPKGCEAEEIRALWKATRQKIPLDERWLSLLLSTPQGPEPRRAETCGEEAMIPVPTRPASEPEGHAGKDQATLLRHNLPFPKNPFFTGRESELVHLQHLFEQNAQIAITQPVSVSGLGGIGKTQLALEYAHRCSPHVYQNVLWVSASDRSSLQASYLSLAHLLQLPEQQEREVEWIIQAVKSWLEEHTNWLLILDNADDLSLARAYLPTKPRGHILLTTRSQIVGNLAILLQVEAFSPEEGLLFLLRRCGLRPARTRLEDLGSNLRREALALVELLGGHPLALDQAGAYIEETREPGVGVCGASFAEYRQLYQQQHRILLQRRGLLFDEHPDTVATTLEISVQKACELHPRCAEVLAFCALLHPDAIPEELLREESGLNLDLLQFNEVMRALRRYSLIKRDSKKQVLSLHRLVQAVIKDGMDTQEFEQWTERVICTVNAACPEVTFEAWSQCERYLPHVLVCANWREEHKAISPSQAAQLLSKGGLYLRQRGQYGRAEPLLVQSLSLCEQHLGAEHPETATSLHRLALLYWNQGKYEEAERLYQRALTIRKQQLGSEHPDIASSLNNLANLYSDQGKYEKAEQLYYRALAIKEQQLGAEHLSTSRSLNNLAALYYRQGKYEQAEPLYRRAISIYEQQLGAEHPCTAESLGNLAEVFQEQGKYEQAELLYRRALAIKEQRLGAEHPCTAESLNTLANLYREQGKYSLAEPLYQRALSIREQQLGAEHPETARSLNDLAVLYLQQGKYEEAEPLYQRALSIREQQLGAEHPDTAESLNDLAVLYLQQDKYEQAELLYQCPLALQEQPIPAQDPQLEQEVGGVEAPIAESSAQISEPDQPAQERQKRQSHIVTVIGNAEAKARVQEPVFSREVFTRETTFACVKCGQTVTQQRYPSHTPLYCSDACRNEACKEQTRKRVARLRERRRQAASNTSTQEGVTKYPRDAQ